MITEQNYYDLDNHGLSQSKIKMYQKCPNYMYRACISGDLKRKDNKNFMVGREVDSILTEMDRFQNTIIAPYADFRSKDAREWKADQEAQGKTVVKESEYEYIMSIAIAVQDTSIWKDIEKNFVMQEIIIRPDKELGEHFDCLYGKLDAYKIEDGVCIILDLKTSNTIDRRQFFYKAEDLGYFKQIWMYRELLRWKYPEIKEFRYYFVVAEKSEPFKVALFKVPEILIDRCENDMAETIDKIAKDKEFKKQDITWKDEVLLTDDDQYEPKD